MPVPYPVTAAGEMLKDAVAAQPAVTLLDLLASDATSAPAGWAFVARPDGLKAAVTAGGVPANAAAQAAVLAADVTPAGVTARFEAADPERKAVRDAADAAVSDIDAFLLIADTATAAQVRQATKRLAQMMRVVILRLKQID